MFKDCQWVHHTDYGSYLEVHTQDADGRFRDFKLWFHTKGGHERHELMAYAKEWQYRRNRPLESM